MKIKKLLDYLNGAVEWRDEVGDYDLMVAIAKPSVGQRAMDKVTDIQIGLDWEAQKVILRTEKNLVPKSQKENVWDMALDLIYWLAYEKGNGRSQTYESRQARRILETAGYKKLEKRKEK